jgi:hypothetical protein
MIENNIKVNSILTDEKIEDNFDTHKNEYYDIITTEECFNIDSQNGEKDKDANSKTLLIDC